MMNDKKSSAVGKKPIYYFQYPMPYSQCLIHYALNLKPQTLNHIQ
jgi:hypothetical protein